MKQTENMKTKRVSNHSYITAPQHISLHLQLHR